MEHSCNNGSQKQMLVNIVPYYSRYLCGKLILRDFYEHVVIYKSGHGLPKGKIHNYNKYDGDITIRSTCIAHLKTG